MNNKPHPFVQSLNFAASVVAPSFHIVSVRDNNDSDATPRLNYAIVNSTNEIYDPSTRRFSGQISVWLDLFLFEPDNNFDWCKYSELELNQDRQALMYDMGNKLRQILLLIQDPTQALARNEIPTNSNDVIWKKSNFRNLQIVSMQQVAKLGSQSWTGVSCNATFQYNSEQISCCLVDATDVDDLETLRSAFEENSSSYNNITAKINSL